MGVCFALYFCMVSAPLLPRGRQQRPTDIRKHTVLPVPIRLKLPEKISPYVSMGKFLQPILSRTPFGKTASHQKRAHFVQRQGALPWAYWMSDKAAQRSRLCKMRLLWRVFSCVRRPKNRRSFSLSARFRLDSGRPRGYNVTDR